MRPRPLNLPLLLVALGLSACASTDDGPQPIPLPRDTAGTGLLETAGERDLASRVAERLKRSDRLGSGELFLELERLMPSWQMEQRHGRARPIEVRLTQEVVAHFDQVTAALHAGPHERRVVAAWALGFSRVPDNSLGVQTPHRQAVQELVKAVETADDVVMSNIMLALWRLGEPSTPLQPLLDVLAQHHDAASRANAALAIATTLTVGTAPQAVPTVTAALADSDPKVRLHAATVAQRYAHPTYTTHLVSALPHEPMSLVRAAMAAALGRSGDPARAAPALIPLLDSSEPMEVAHAHRALVALFGTDRGRFPDDWRGLVPAAGQR